MAMNNATNTKEQAMTRHPITAMHKSARTVVNAFNADADASVTVFVASTVNGAKYWIQQAIHGRVTFRRATTKIATVIAWLQDIEDACNEGEAVVTEINDATIQAIRAL